MITYYHHEPFLMLFEAGDEMRANFIIHGSNLGTNTSLDVCDIFNSSSNIVHLLTADANNSMTTDLLTASDKVATDKVIVVFMWFFVLALMWQPCRSINWRGWLSDLSDYVSPTYLENREENREEDREDDENLDLDLDALEYKVVSAITVSNYQARLEGKFDGDIPHWLCDPITRDIMRYPVTLSSGISYDLLILIQYAKTLPHGTFPCPITRKIISKTELFSGLNIALNDAIEAFVAKQERKYSAAQTARFFQQPRIETASASAVQSFQP